MQDILLSHVFEYLARSTSQPSIRENYLVFAKCCISVVTQEIAFSQIFLNASDGKLLCRINAVNERVSYNAYNIGS